MNNEQQAGLNAAWNLFDLGVPIFWAPKCPGATCIRPGCDRELHLPRRWQETIPEDGRAAITNWRPGDGLGAVMGHVFDAVDIDPRNGGHESTLDALTTYGRQRTPRGGVHGLIRLLKVGKHQSVLPGVDLQGGRSDGTGRGFIWIAPTVRHGAAYRWETPPFIPKPNGRRDDSADWLLKIINEGQRKTHEDFYGVVPPPDAHQPPPTYVAAFFTEDIPAYVNAEPGTGDTRLFQLACRAREFANAHWVDLAEVLDALDTARLMRIENHPHGEGQSEADWKRILVSSKRAVGSKKAVRSEGLKVGGVAVNQAPKGDAVPAPGSAGEGTTVPVEGTGKLRLVPLAGIKPARVRWLRHDRIPIGEITLVAGRENTGKSTYLAHLAAQVTRGTALGEFDGKPKSVIYVANEDSMRHTLVPRLMAAGADMDRIYTVESTLDAGLLLPTDVTELGELAREVDAGAIMLDPIISLIAEDLSTYSAKDLRKALEPLRRAAEAADASVVALVHFNKGDGDVLTKISGSRGWVEVARAVLGVAEDEENQHVVLSQVKNNLGRTRGLSNWAFVVKEHLFDADDGSQGSTGRLEWIKKVDDGVAELLSPKPGRPKKGEEHSVAAWIVSEATVREALVPTRDVEAHFEKVAGWSRATTHRRLKQAVGSGLVSHSHGAYGVSGGSPA